MINKKLILATILSSVIITAGCSNNKQPENNDTKKTEQKTQAHNFLVKDENGNDVKLSDFKRKKVYINIWASWCGPCIKEMPELEKLYQKLKDDKNIVFLAITSPKDEIFENKRPSDETKRVILDKARENNITYPILFDFQDSVMSNYFIQGYPTHIFINSDGTINAQILGMMDEKTLSKQIDNLK